MCRVTELVGVSKSAVPTCWDQPGIDGELGVASVADGIVVAPTFLFADRDTGRAMNGGTG